MSSVPSVRACFCPIVRMSQCRMAPLPSICRMAPLPSVHLSVRALLYLSAVRGESKHTPRANATSKRDEWAQVSVIFYATYAIYTTGGSVHTAGHTTIIHAMIHAYILE